MERIGFECDAMATEAAVGIEEGVFDDGSEIFGFEQFKSESTAAGKERGDDVEGGIFGGGTDQGDGAGFDMGEEGVLLGAVKAVEFVDEEDGAAVGDAFAVSGFVDQFADVGDA